MGECPTFDYYNCRFHDDDFKGHGFKAVAHVRSRNQTFIGHGK